ncbi:DEHYDRATION-RESPONSIVE ELEMENT-BINDING PROTEIN 1D [Salix purpurea]|uniref:DEHYDRATION-RESPONSIVE ELEMENT-BINDING PROTEIN 1D n=1 Tax=Salix purpurea TaxID=77065 RepID=A0A9Q0PRC5_SALPP|nr:DEHYDRATION-RESPONSIVE ELEMENT-BINDING PROTEIN 1D [Salix purpurea]
MAARAHDVAALALKGEFATLNFLDSPSILPPAKSSSARDIQRAARAATEVSRQTASSCSSSSSPDHKKLSMRDKVNESFDFIFQVIFPHEKGTEIANEELFSNMAMSCSDNCSEKVPNYSL